MGWPVKIAPSLSQRKLHGVSLCSVTYCVSRGLVPDGSPETGSALMNDGKTLLDLKYFPIVLTRNGWNVFAKSHSREFEGLELSKIGRCEKLRKSFYKAAAKIFALKQWKIRIHRNEFILFLFHQILNIYNRRIVDHAKSDHGKLSYLSYLHKRNNKIVSNKEVEFNFSFTHLIMYSFDLWCIFRFSAFC